MICLIIVDGVKPLRRFQTMVSSDQIIYNLSLFLNLLTTVKISVLLEHFSCHFLSLITPKWEI